MATEKARLTYSDSRGLADKIRIMLCVAGVPYEDRSLKKRSEFLEIREKDDLLFDQTPLLEYNGLKLVQSNSIMRYLASKFSMFGRNPEEQVRIDMLYDGSRDWHSPLLGVGIVTSAEECCAKGQKALAKFGPVYEKELETNKTGFLVGDSMTLADVGLFETALQVEDYLGKESFKKYPNIQAFMEKMRTDKGIQNYFQNHRFAKLTPERVKEIKTMYLLE